jgi:hypothetical protein
MDLSLCVALEPIRRTCVARCLRLSPLATRCERSFDASMGKTYWP